MQPMCSNVQTLTAVSQLHMSVTVIMIVKIGPTNRTAVSDIFINYRNLSSHIGIHTTAAHFSIMWP